MDKKELEGIAQQYIIDCNVLGAVVALEGGVVELNGLLVDFIQYVDIKKSAATGAN